MLKKKPYGFLLFSVLISAAFLAICSKSSPLYPMNDWVDVNCFFTVGKSILQGLVPYRDLYEQKGPVLYFLYAIAALISRRSFLGAYFLDAVSFGLFLYFSGRIARLYLGNRMAVYAIVLALGAAIPTSRAFAHGGSVELLSLWMLAYSLYAIVLAVREKRLLKNREVFCIGACAAMVLYIKFTIVGFYLGLALYVVLWYLCWEKQPKALPAAIGWFLGGVAAVSAVVFAYFLLNGAVSDFLTAYFYNNLFLYPKETGNRWLSILLCVSTTFTANPGYSWFLIIGWLWLPLNRHGEGKTFTAVTLSFLCLAVGTYWGGRGYSYYGLILAAYAVFGLIAIVELLDLIRVTKLYRFLTRQSRTVTAALLAVFAAALLWLSYTCSANTYLMGCSKEDMPQYRFAAEINQVENPTLLNYGFLDGGFYFAADVVPTCKFFCYLNIPLPELNATQKQQIENGQFDFIVTRNYHLEEYGMDSSQYVCIDAAQMYFEGVNWTYYLYQRTAMPVE